MWIYRFVSDTFEVLEGRDARRLGWVCPYFYNAKHHPVEAPFAVSPDSDSSPSRIGDSLKFAFMTRSGRRCSLIESRII